MKSESELSEKLDLIPVGNPSDERLVKFSYRRESQFQPLNEMMIDSEKVVQRALEKGVNIKMVLATQKHYLKYCELFARQKNTKFFLASQAMMAEIVGHRIHQSMMALAERPALARLEDLGQRILCLNKVTDSSNVGAIMRNAHALHYDSILFDSEGCHPYVRRAVRVSMGSVFHLKIHQCQNLCATLSTLKTKGYQIISAGLWDDSAALDEVTVGQKHVVVVGNEDQGVESGVVDISDAKVAIDIAPTADSLNAACASAIMLYQLSKNNLNGS